MGFGKVAPAPFKMVCPNTPRGRRTHSKRSIALRITREFLLTLDISVLSAQRYRMVTNEWISHEQLGSHRSTEVKANAKPVGGRSLAGRAHCRENRHVTRSASAVHEACLSPGHTRLPAGSVQTAPGSVPAPPSVADRRSHPAYRRGARPDAASSERVLPYCRQCTW